MVKDFLSEVSVFRIQEHKDLTNQNTTHLLQEGVGRPDTGTW
jgi:hypothetical protein